RVGNLRRQKREQQGVAMETIETFNSAEIDGIRTILIEEIQRLPARYRVAVLLCYLGGKTRREASQQLGWPEGTVATRLSRAKDLLRNRLTRRGVLFPAAAFATLLEQATAPAVLPAALVRSTVEMGLLIAAGKATAGLMSVGVATLTEEVLRTML